MALSRNKPENLPVDAIILSEKEAIQYQVNFLKKWKDQSDLWSFNYGGIVLATLSAFTGIYVNNHFRTRFRLAKYGQLSSYLPICVIPPLLSYILHATIVLPDVVLQKDCAVCIEMRSSAIQAFTGMIFPTVLSPLATLSLAVRYQTYNVPYLSEPLKVISLVRKFTNPIGNTLFCIFLGHAVAAAAVTSFEAKNIQRVNDKLALLGYEYK